MYVTEIEVDCNSRGMAARLVSTQQSRMKAI
jgi:hypothetical protein